MSSLERGGKSTYLFFAAHSKFWIHTHKFGKFDFFTKTEKFTEQGKST